MRSASAEREFTKKPRRRARGFGKVAPELFAQTEVFDDRLITLTGGTFEIIKQTAALRDEFEQSAARGVVFTVGFEVFGQVVDAFRDQGHLNACAAGIFFMKSQGTDFNCFCFSHFFFRFGIGENDTKPCVLQVIPVAEKGGNVIFRDFWVVFLSFRGFFPGISRRMMTNGLALRNGTGKLPRWLSI